MPLAKGQRVGTFEVIDLLGKGGMGEVYRARDKKLGRDVAVKVLLQTFAKDAERLARFEREAKLLAALNHPGIATLYGLEELEGQQVLVMELIEGETLAERLARGPLSFDEALPLFLQLAEALEAAHEKGIIHRDLKPANIKQTPEGKPKILDFGLAKALSADEDVSAETSQSPTLTKGTALGAIMGTASYMSPEQARGKVVDKRSDIWAFGCCLYEALTGNKAFDGDTVPDILSTVLQAQPDWNLAGSTPAHVRRLLRRCLEKNVLLRLRDIGEARIELATGDTTPSVEPRRASPGWRGYAGVVAATAVIVGAAVWNLTSPRDAVSPPVTRFEIDVPDLTVNLMTGNPIAISPDGSRLVYEAGGELHLRSLNELEAQPVPNTKGGYSPFFSPDGESVGFFTPTQLKRVSLRGGSASSIAAVSNGRSGVWSTSDDIVFDVMGPTGLLRVPASGGTPELITELAEGEVDHGHVGQFLPGGAWLTYGIVYGAWDDASIVLHSLATGENKRVLEEGETALYAPSGHLVYARGGALHAAAFDLETLQVIGPPVVAVDGVVHPFEGSAPLFTLSRNGTLAYVYGESGGRMFHLAWVDRTGREELLPLEPRPYMEPRLSPDGSRLAVAEADTDLNLDIRMGVTLILTPIIANCVSARHCREP